MPFSRLAYDDFTRADNASLGSAWTTRFTGADAFKIVSNAAALTVATTDCNEFYSSISNWPPNQYSQAAISGLSGATANHCGVGVAVRSMVDNIGGGPTYIWFYGAVVNAAASNQVEVFKHLGSYSSVLITQLTRTWVDGDILRMEAVGDILRIYANGVQLGADIIDTSITQGAPGLASQSDTNLASARIDNWEGGADTTPLPQVSVPSRGGQFW